MKLFRWLTLSALVVCTVLFSFSLSVPRTISPARNSNHADIPVAAQPAISATIGKDNAAYHFRADERGWVATHAQQALTAHLTDAGATIEANDARLTMQLVAYGYGDVMNVAMPASPQANANRVEYVRGDVTEWYVNGPVGIEQGFTVQSPTSTLRVQLPTSNFTLALALDTDLTATVDADGAGLSLTRVDGTTALHYTGLTAFDATGKELRAWMEIGEGEVTSLLQIHVDAANAQYPITIDPWIQTAKLTASDGVANDEFGYSVAISGDTIVVGAPNATVTNTLLDKVFSGAGAAYVFVKPTAGWGTTSTYAAKLVNLGSGANYHFGYSVAISGDTIVVGEPNYSLTVDYPELGGAYVFVKPAGGWTGTLTQTAALMHDYAIRGHFGWSVAISADANTVVVGAPQNGSNNQGVAYVFLKPAGGWVSSNSSAQLTAADGYQLGYSVAISGDTIVVGARGDGISQQGSAYVFVKPTGGWNGTMTQSAKLTASISATLGFGYAVAISGDTIVVSAPGGFAISGAVYVFVKPTGGWSGVMTETANPTASDRTELVGFAVAISGNIIVVAAPGTGSAGTEAVYVFVKPTGGWSGTVSQTFKLTNPTGAVSGGFGHSVALNNSTNTIVAGAHEENSNQGSTYVFDPTQVYVDAAGSCGGNTPCYNNFASGINAAISTGNVTAYPGTYNESVNVSKNITVTLSGATFSIDGALTQSMGIFNAPNTSLALTGNLARTGGTFNHNNGTFVFAGSGTQTVTGNFTFYNLTVNPGAFVDVGANVLTVNHTLTNNGAMRRSPPMQSVAIPVSFLDPVGKTTMTLTPTGVSPLGNTSVIIVTHQSPGGGNAPCGGATLGGAPVLRFFDIHPQNTSGIAATVRLYFAPTEANDNSIANLGIFHCAGTTWMRLSGTPVTGTDAATGYSYIESANVTSFSPFAISGGPGAPTAVTLSSFEARTRTFDLGAWFAELLRRVKR